MSSTGICDLFRFVPVYIPVLIKGHLLSYSLWECLCLKVNYLLSACLSAFEACVLAMSMLSVLGIFIKSPASFWFGGTGEDVCEGSSTNVAAQAHYL